MAKKNLYHICDCTSGRDWVVMARSIKKAEEKLRKLGCFDGNEEPEELCTDPSIEGVIEIGARIKTDLY